MKQIFENNRMYITSMEKVLSIELDYEMLI